MKIKLIEPAKLNKEFTEQIKEFMGKYGEEVLAIMPIERTDSFLLSSTRYTDGFYVFFQKDGKIMMRVVTETGTVLTYGTACELPHQ